MKPKDRDELDDAAWYRLRVQHSADALDVDCEIDLAPVEPPGSMRLTLTCNDDPEDYDLEGWSELCREVPILLHRFGVKFREGGDGFDPLDGRPFARWVLSDFPSRDVRNRH